MPQPLECPVCGFNAWVAPSESEQTVRCAECQSEIEVPKEKVSSKSRKRKKKKKRKAVSSPKQPAVATKEVVSNSASGLVDCIVEDWVSNYEIGDTQFSHMYSSQSPTAGEKDNDDDDVPTKKPDDDRVESVVAQELLPPEDATDVTPVTEAPSETAADPIVEKALADAAKAEKASGASVPSEKVVDAVVRETQSAPAKPFVSKYARSNLPKAKVTSAVSSPKKASLYAKADKLAKPAKQAKPARRSVAPAPNRRMTNDPYDRVDPSMICLMIREISANMAVIEFPVQLLELSGFRASMPMRCIVNSNAPVEGLIAKPFPWVDKLKNSTETVQEMANRFAKKVPPKQSEAEFVDSLHMIMELPPPFNLPMPFYISPEEERGFEPLTKVVGTKYGLGCVVTVPLSDTVLEWVGRVNGLYSREYHDLSQAVYSQTNHKLASVPDKTRRRINEWFECKPDEEFLLFLPDSDFTKKDDGLAGLILTDRRLICRRYRQKTELSLAKPCELIAKEDGLITDVSLRREDGSIRKIVRLRREGAYMVSLLLESIGQFVTMVNVTEGE
jgi:hypothetical protein